MDARKDAAMSDAPAPTPDALQDALVIAHAEAADMRTDLWIKGLFALIDAAGFAVVPKVATEDMRLAGVEAARLHRIKLQEIAARNGGLPADNSDPDWDARLAAGAVKP